MREDRQERAGKPAKAQRDRRMTRRQAAPSLVVEYVQVGAPEDERRSRVAMHRIMREAWEREGRGASAGTSER